MSGIHDARPRTPDGVPTTVSPSVIATLLRAFGPANAQKELQQSARNADSFVSYFGGFRGNRDWSCAFELPNAHCGCRASPRPLNSARPSVPAQPGAG